MDKKEELLNKYRTENGIPYSEIVDDFKSPSDVPYFVKLQAKEWYERSEEIKLRDSKKCSKCGTGNTNFGPGIGHHEIVSRTYEIPTSTPNGEKFIHEMKQEYLKRYDEPRNLQVHHEYYIEGRLPWEYADEALKTLCNKCHQEIHEEKIIKRYKSEKKVKEEKLNPCKRCGAKGFIPEYSHVKGGICFRCEGERFEEL